ncbi:MAG: hypothetical protein GY771_02890 [bacterium]|nr:hypothetical protein [bacterium]
MEKETDTSTIKIGDVEYVRADSVNVRPLEIGETRIIVADKGWVFAGDCTDNEDGTVTITNAKNIRRWGTTRGLGELVNGPTSKTVVDDYGTVTTRPVVTLAVTGGW